MRHEPLILGLAALALGGCVSHVEGNTQDPAFGQALRQNLMAQVADPAARYARTQEPASSGPRAALAQTRYQKGEVTQPVNQGTTDIRSRSGSGSGSGGGN